MVKRACALIRISMTIEEHARLVAMKPYAPRIWYIQWSMGSIEGHVKHALWLRECLQLWITMD